MRLLIFLGMLMAGSAIAGTTRVCTDIQTTCTDGPSTRTIDGMRVIRSCWQRTTHFGCIEPNVSDTCTAPRDRGCREMSAHCLEHATVAGAPRCITEQREYACPTGGGESSTVADCAGQQYCIYGNCFDTGTAPDGDFKKAVTSLEMTREAGVYLDQENLRIFRGEDRRCAKTVLRNCCRGSRHDAADLTNRAVQGGSQHTYDVLSDSGMPSTIATGIDPLGYVLRASHDVIAEMADCDKDDALTTMRRRRNLCHYVGEYCSRKIDLGLMRICVEHKETYCCFNSKMARLIAEAARAQLPGLDWGSPRAPACHGITVAQFQQLDLSKIDFSEIHDDIRPVSTRSHAGQRQTIPRSYFDPRQDTP